MIPLEFRGAALDMDAILHLLVVFAGPLDAEPPTLPAEGYDVVATDKGWSTFSRDATLVVVHGGRVEGRDVIHEREAVLRGPRGRVRWSWESWFTFDTVAYVHLHVHAPCGVAVVGHDAVLAAFPALESRSWALLRDSGPS